MMPPLEHRTFSRILQENPKNTEKAKFSRTIEHWKSYRVTHEKVYLFLRILYFLFKLKEFGIDKYIFINTAWICLRFV